MMDNWTVDLLLGDCLEMLKELDDNSVDAVVCDPPYGLSKEPDMAEVLKHWLAGDDYTHKGGGFMGKTWDSFVPGPAVWRECLRVLKPGGHLLAFFGTRTYDIGTLAIRLAGFEIRDQVGWAYGSGFPKSLDVSKAIDAQVLTGGSHSRNIKRAIAARPGEVRETATLPNNGVMSGDRKGGITNDIIATEAAREWKGWGTALKPAWEPICVARKPLEGTVAANVQKWGVGALNIDGCRVESDARPNIVPDRRRFTGNSWEGGVDGSLCGSKAAGTTTQGRWPANLIHDGSDEVLALFPDSKGQQGDVRGDEPSGVTDEIYGKFAGRVPAAKRGDSGSAARFFYCAKTGKKDRNEGLDHLPDQEWRHEGAAIPERANRPFLPSKNNHPTVKPTELMRYLCRLVTPPGGIVLDPFMGSGSTGKAAMLEGFRFVGIEREEAYLDIAEARIMAAKAEAGR